MPVKHTLVPIVFFKASSRFLSLFIKEFEVHVETGLNSTRKFVRIAAAREARLNDKAKC